MELLHIFGRQYTGFNMSIGYDNLAINSGLLLHLTFEEMTGILAHDRAKPAHPHTLIGVPTWNSLGNGLPYLDFIRANPDWLECSIADTADLNFTDGDFSLCAWVQPDLLSFNLFDRGLWAVDGWYLSVGALGQTIIETNQGGDSQLSVGADGGVVVGTWSLISMSRSGTSARLFLNGVDNTDTVDVHTNPLTSNRKLHIGIYNSEVAAQYDGKIAGGPCGPRIWGRAVSALEWPLVFNMERDWFGV